MSDTWLDHGHGADASRLATVFSSTTAGPEVPGRTGPGPARGARFAGPLAVALAAVFAVLGSAGAVYAVRESLFPSLGAPTSPSVWQNPVPPDDLAPTSPDAAGTTTTTATTTTTVVIPVGPAATAPSSTIDDHGGDRDAGSDHSGPDNAGSGSDDTGPDHSAPDDSGSASDNSGSGSDDSGSGSDNSGSGSDNSGSGSDNSGSGSDDTGSDHSGSGDG